MKQNEIRLGRRLEDRLQVVEEVLAAIGIGGMVFLAWLAMHLG